MQDKKPSYSCEVCFKTFQFRGAYTDHLKTHANTDVRHECSECPCFFKNRGHLKTHIKEVHRSHTRIYKCSQCSRKFDSKPLYTQHRRREHTQSTRHQCAFCQHVYATKNSLKWHIHINHNKDFRKSKCPYCPSEFKWPHHLRVHIKKSHMEQGFTPTDLLKKGLTSIRRKSNNCIVCDVKFEKKLELMLHLRNVHKQELDIYKCCRCDAVFNLKSSLRNHIIDHKRRKDGYMHECPQCHPEITPQLFVQEKETDTLVEDNRTEIEKELIDFEITLMEDEDIRGMIRCRLKHKPRRRRRTGLLMKTDVEPENIVVEPTILDSGKYEVAAVDGDVAGGDTGRQIQVCLERISAHECRLCKCTFSHEDTLCMHMSVTHPTAPVTSNKNITIAATSEDVVSPECSVKDVSTPKTSDSKGTPKKDTAPEKDVTTPKSVENVDEVSQADKDVFNTPKRDEKDANGRTPKSVENVDKVSQADKDVLNTPKRDEKDANVRTPKSVENVDKVSQADKDVLNTPKRDEKDANVRTPKSVENVDKITQAAKDVLNTPKRDEKDANVRTPKSVEKVDKVIKADKDVLNTPKRDEKDPKIKTTEKNVTPKKVAWKKSYTCHVCMEKFNMPLQLGRHIRLTHNLIKCKLCKTSFTKTKVDTHKCIKRKSVSVKTERKSPKASNVRIAASPKKRTKKGTLEECGKCALYFNTRLELIRHISDVHMFTGKQKEKDDFSCDKCNTKFLSRDEVSGHVKICKGDK